MQESRQGRERDFSFLSPPTCLCMQEPSTRTDSLALLWQLLLFVPLNTAAKAQTSPCLLSPKLQNREQRDRTQQVDPGAGVCIVFLSQYCLRTNRTGAPCAGYYSQTVAPETTSLSPSLNQRHFKFAQDLTMEKIPPWKSTSYKCFHAFPNWKLFLRLQNSFPYIKRWVNTSPWESHIRWLHSHSLMHIHPYIYLEIIPPELKGGCMGQGKGRAGLSPCPASSPISRLIPSFLPNKSVILAPTNSSHCATNGTVGAHISIWYLRKGTKPFAHPCSKNSFWFHCRPLMSEHVSSPQRHIVIKVDVMNSFTSSNKDFKMWLEKKLSCTVKFKNTSFLRLDYLVS